MVEIDQPKVTLYIQRFLYFAILLWKQNSQFIFSIRFRQVRNLGYIKLQKYILVFLAKTVCFMWQE